MKQFLQVVMVGFAFLLPSIVLAQGVETDIKTPPLQNSDEFTIPIAVHNINPVSNWAGVLMEVHILDNTEIDIDAIDPAPPMLGVPMANPFGPRSNNSQSVAKLFTAWHPNAPGSGITIPGSVNQPAFIFDGHVKGSNPAGNSDVDVQLRFWNIRHFGPNNIGSTIITLQPSVQIYVRSSIQDQQQLHQPNSIYHFPNNPPAIGEGHWLHLYEPATFHLFPGPGSTYIATFLNTATLGIDHVPEPAAGVLMACGGVGLCLAWRARRKRLAA